jgi:hypothetical protein
MFKFLAGSCHSVVADVVSFLDQKRGRERAKASVDDVNSVISIGEQA